MIVGNGNRRCDPGRDGHRLQGIAVGSIDAGALASRDRGGDRMGMRMLTWRTRRPVGAAGSHAGDIAPPMRVGALLRCVVDHRRSAIGDAPWRREHRSSAHGQAHGKPGVAPLRRRTPLGRHRFRRSPSVGARAASGAQMAHRSACGRDPGCSSSASRRSSEGAAHDDSVARVRSRTARRRMSGSDGG